MKSNTPSQNLLPAIIISLLSPLIYDHFFSIKPEITKINENISTVLSNSEITNKIIKDIADRYTKKDINGVDCKVGISSEMSANNVGVAENNKYGLKGADQIYITNPYSVFCPVMRFTVYLKEPDLNNPSQCDLFLSKEAIEKLDIKKRDFYKGVFNMKIHIGEN